ncbi:hypothetical protein FNF27_02658 [Cafeteria roenbergensis]|nr:hypothetical protein FNF29_05159 [Cafeteria roenbergensis]KAA0160656.1 hypothetical protein FNF31_04207 [Cafeteria roenbergensis]KAA0175937.1 hypothetical protein FNF27_02658 [Cafeteria roenbergensis]|eukprot:KAA0150584.1 hypothetical protein FNF29_05159 [Cafeteria roenbergensis]
MPSRAFSVTVSALSAAAGEPKEERKATGLFGSIMADFRAEQEDMKGLSGWGKVKHLFSRYGFLSIVVYETVFFSALGGFYGLFVLNGNFGLDVNPMLDTLGMTDTVTGLLHHFGMAEEGEPLSPGATSLALSIVATELSEFWRLPLTIVLLPTISRRVLGRKFDSPAKPPTPGNGSGPGAEQER